MTDIIPDDFEQDYEPVYNPYYLLDDGRIYDKDKKVFVTAETDADFKAFKDAGNSPLSIGPNGYTLEQLKRSVIKFYGWEMGDCLLSLDELKAKKLQELDDIAASFEDNLNKNMYFVSSLGFKVNGDRRTRSNIEDLISMLPDDETTIGYRDYDNQEQQVTRPQLQTMLKELIQTGLGCYTTKWKLQAQINNAQSATDLEQVKIEFKWPDYSEQS